MTAIVPVPRINANDNKVEVVQWHVADGDYVDADQDIVDLETSKASVTITAETSGYIKHFAVKGEVVRVGDPLYTCGETPAEVDGQLDAEALSRDSFSAVAQVASAVSAPRIESSVIAPSAGNFATTRFSAAARKLLAERGLSPEAFQNRGLVTVDMVDPSFSKVAVSASIATGRTMPGVQPVPSASRSEPVSLSKQAEIDSLTVGESGNVNSMLSVYFESHGIRARLKAEGAFGGNIQPLLLFEISRLLRQWPKLTACYANEEIHYFDRVDLGLAVDLGRGLKVITIRGADQLLPIQFHETTLDIGQRYLENRIIPEELIGSTFTITDLSGLEVLHFHPLINGAQSAILGVGGDSRMAGHPMTFNLTFDHRVTNGREVADFLNALRDRVLSYELAPSPPQGDALSVQAAVSNAPSEISCDVCGVDLPSYLRDFRRDAVMLAYYREDGSQGAICHRCTTGL